MYPISPPLIGLQTCLTADQIMPTACLLLPFIMAPIMFYVNAAFPVHTVHDLCLDTHEHPIIKVSLTLPNKPSRKMKGQNAGSG